jgi:hypothetical protein
MQQDQYAPDEVADLLEIDIEVVRHAAFTGEPRAQIIEHHIIAISRAEVPTWLRVEEGSERAHTLQPTSEAQLPTSTGIGGDQ